MTATHAIDLVCSTAHARCLSKQRSTLLTRPPVTRQQRQRRRFNLCASVVADQNDYTSADLRHVLPGGMQLEILRCLPQSPQAKRAPLLFLHGSGHGAWCWNDKFCPHFASQGRDCWAISFRGQGHGSPVEKGSVPGTLVSNAADVAHFVATLPQPPVMICHSFGGLVLQKYLQHMEVESWPCPSGVAFLAAGPPAGSGGVVKRLFLATPLRWFRILWGFITRSYLRSAEATRFLFFSEQLPQEDLLRYHKFLVDQPGGSIVDVGKMRKEMPIQLPPLKQLPPTFVAGARSDAIVDSQAVEELAEALGTEARFFDGGHDMMLDTHWKDVAGSMEEWLQTIDRK